ncbi:MAG: NUDIX hydrolase [Pseudomonadota bacterium]|jgi:ADP-ribose pyrophosphatase
MKVIRSEVLYQGRLRGIRELVENDSGVQYLHETIEHPGAVVVLPLTEQGNIVCVSQYRRSIRSVVLELPAGTLEKNEAPLDCAKREIQEEIGFAARTMIPLGTLLPAPGFCNEVQHLFVARELYPQSAEKDEDEDISVVTLSVSGFEERVISGEINDAKTIALFFKARLAGLI